jgi:cytochrome c oxidase cbb3-type subunit 1
MNTTSSTAYNYKVVRQFAIMTVVWGIVGMGLGVFSPPSSPGRPQLDLPWTSFGRLRPLHTNAVIFAFGGCACSPPRIRCNAPARPPCSRRASPRSVLGLATGDPAGGDQPAAGLHQLKEYAELEWPIDILITIVWVAYAMVFFGTLMKRNTKHIYVGNWFFGAFILTVAILHIVNNLELPVSLTKSYSVYAGPPTPWCSGGTATTPWASSSPPASWG